MLRILIYVAPELKSEIIEKQVEERKSKQVKEIENQNILIDPK
jgi:hypothetical protein